MRSKGKAAATPAENGTDSPARRAIQYRAAFLDAVTPEDVREVSVALLERAKGGDPAAARLLLDRVLGSAAVEGWPSAEKAEILDQLSSW